MNPTTQEAAALRAAYERNPQGTLRTTWCFSWWQRGGEPGPDWLSDKIDLAAAAGRVTGHYTRTRNAPAPPFRPQVDEYTGSVPLELALRLLGALFEQKLFEQTLPSEGNANLADALRQTFDLTIGPAQLLKTLHEPTAAELGEVASACHALAAHLRDTGIRREHPPQ